MKFHFREGASLELNLKAPKNTSGKSKKIYRGIFVRTLNKGRTHHLYSSDRLYICSHYQKEIDKVYEWIDRNIEEIGRRVGEFTTIQSPTLFDNWEAKEEPLVESK